MTKMTATMHTLSEADLDAVAGGLKNDPMNTAMKMIECSSAIAGGKGIQDWTNRDLPPTDDATSVTGYPLTGLPWPKVGA